MRAVGSPPVAGVGAVAVAEAQWEAEAGALPPVLAQGLALPVRESALPPSETEMPRASRATPAASSKAPPGSAPAWPLGPPTPEPG